MDVVVVLDVAPGLVDDVGGQRCPDDEEEEEDAAAAETATAAAAAAAAVAANRANGASVLSGVPHRDGSCDAGLGDDDAGGNLLPPL